MMKRPLWLLLLVLMALAAAVLIRTVTFRSKQHHVRAKPTPTPTVRALEHFRKSITYKTVSFANPELRDTSEFLGFRKFLEQSYPLVHQRLAREIVKDYTILFRWNGRNKQAAPIVLMAHQDVVPVEDNTQNIWSVQPFSGVLKDGFVWGRGATDDKINLIAILESVEKMLAEGFQPERTIYLVFGHDEEIGGTGALEVVRLFKERGVKPDLVLDEGGMITREKVPGLDKTVALLGTSEKGVLTLELKVEKGGGHAAMPERETAIGILAEAIARLNKNQFEPRFSPSTQDFVQCIGPEMPFKQRMAFANLWLFRPLINSIYEQSNGGNAMIRTTLVPTIIKGGVKENVIPTVATATLNLRLLPGDSSEAVQRRIREIVADERVLVTVIDYHPATSVTPMESYAYKTVEDAVRQTYDSVIATPFLMIAATDSRHFTDISKGIIKFSPMVDPIGFHGIDERVSVDSYAKSLLFFEELIRKL
jgi:carboxypeptidase PM20D1